MEWADGLWILISSLCEGLDVWTDVCHVYDLVYHTCLCAVLRTGLLCVHVDHVVHLVNDWLKRLACLLSLYKLSGVHSVGSCLAWHYVVLAGACSQGEYICIVALRSAQNVVGSSTGLTDCNL